MIVNAGCVYTHVMHSLVESRFTEHRNFVGTHERQIWVALMVEVSNVKSVYGEITFRIDCDSFTLKIEKCEENIYSRSWRFNDQFSPEA